jgi:hypothetical protein
LPGVQSIRRSAATSAAAQRVVAHADHQPHEHLVDERSHPRQQPERPAARPRAGVALGDLRHRGGVAAGRVGGEQRGDRRARGRVSSVVAVEDRARRGERQDRPAGRSGAGRAGI